MLRATYGDLCCAQNYVAYGFPEGRRLAARALTAPDGQGGDSDRWVVGQHIFGSFGSATIAVQLDDPSLDTTNIYAETDLEMKAKALATCELAGEPKTTKRWRENPQLMSFLRSL